MDTNQLLGAKLAMAASKPAFGMTASVGSGTAVLLTWLGVLTPIVGFISVCIGLCAAYYSLKHNKALCKKDKESK